MKTHKPHHNDMCIRITWVVLVVTIVLTILMFYTIFANAANTTNTNTYDTQPITEVCGATTDTIRMCFAEVVWYDNGYGTIQTEDGCYWNFDNIYLPDSNNTNLLVWIADNNTPRNFFDDYIVKMWSECH